MVDTKVSAFSLGTTAPQYVYGINPSGHSRKYHAKQVVNVRDFGAVGDGSTDDHDAIQDAIDAAFGAMPGSPNGQANPELNKELYFPPGNYVCNSPLLIVDTRGGRIYGAGGGISQIFFQNDGSAGSTLGPDPDVTPLFEMDGCSDIEFSELSISNSRNVTLPYATYLTTAGTASGTGLTFTAAAAVVTGNNQLVYNYTNPNSIAAGTRADSNSGGAVTLDTAVASAVGSGDRIMFVTANVGIYLFESGGNGVSGNITFRNISMSNWGFGILAAGTTGCANCILENVQFATPAVAGVRLENPEALNWCVFGGGAEHAARATTYRPFLGTPSQGNLGASYSVVDGQISIITNMSTSCGPATTPTEEISLEGGWGLINAGGNPTAICGGRFEHHLHIAAVDSDIFITAIVMGAGGGTIGTRMLNLTFGGTISCTGVHFSPTEEHIGTGRICDLGTDGVLALRECEFGVHVDGECGISGSGNAVVSMINCSDADQTVLFANFTGRVADYQPQCHGVEFADLPTANAKFTGLKGWITNCNTTTYNANAAGGGSSIVPVFCNGTNWKVG